MRIELLISIGLPNEWSVVHLTYGTKEKAKGARNNLATVTDP